MNTSHAAGNDDPVCAAIEGAEEIRDPLEDIVERTTTAPGAAFEPEVVARLAALRRETGPLSRCCGRN
jgi:hypothetical protein